MYTVFIPRFSSSSIFFPFLKLSKYYLVTYCDGTFDTTTLLPHNCSTLPHPCHTPVTACHTPVTPLPLPLQDASIPVHIDNICQRKYVTVSNDRKLTPTELGKLLVHGYRKVLPLCMYDQSGSIAQPLSVGSLNIRQYLRICPYVIHHTIQGGWVELFPHST